jgi:hypothetical protein
MAQYWILPPFMMNSYFTPVFEIENSKSQVPDSQKPLPH